MTCDDVELSLLEDGPKSAELSTHLEGCARCRAFQADTQALLVPEPVSAAERGLLSGLSARVQQQALARASRTRGLRQVASLALAAGLGAVIAAGVLGRTATPPPAAPAAPEVVQVAAVTAEELPEFEVAWPSLTNEGDVP
ncbi:MAG: hypothetical protein K1X89_14240 [Myxococcaceae bacterium]|nr:hypothetical protein [Myxococcaceae bacterium]